MRPTVVTLPAAMIAMSLPAAKMWTHTIGYRTAIQDENSKGRGVGMGYTTVISIRP